MRKNYKKIFICLVILLGAFFIIHSDFSNKEIQAFNKKLVVYQQPIFIAKFGH